MPATKVDIEAFIKSLQEDYLPRAHAAIRVAVGKFGLYVLGEAAELCPVKTGHLQSSTFPADWQSTVAGEGTQTTMEIGFNADYALYVHENLTAHHAQGQAKFLETAMREKAPELPQFVLDELKAEFG